METNGQEVRTEIAEEQATVPKKKWGKREWVFAGIGAGVVIALTVLLWAVRKPEQQKPRQTAEELEQLKYDSEQRNREKQKADQIRDQAFLMRKGDDNQPQLNSLLKDLEVDKNPGNNLTTPMPDKQAKSEEEAIAHVLRSSPPARSRSDSPAVPQRKVDQPTQSAPSSDLGTNPMFVYSRTFGGARYVDKPQKETVGPSEVASAGSSPGVTVSKGGSPVNGAEPDKKPSAEKAHLIYTDYPPVTLYEGEILEAVLVNRIIADTEPSPVVCQLSKDVFDHSARYVVFPASSRIVGLSQVVNYKGANRLFITFNRIILPNGPSVDLPTSSKAVRALDETGALGVVSKVDRHWFLQFGTAIFFGVLDGISGAAQRNRDAFSAQSAVLGKTSESFDRILENIMSQYSTIVPTIRVDQGKTMKIYLSDDMLISPYAKISERSYYANR
jgi:type IV secretory pathway VirB10-like protein